jgi:hypothetical protein
MGVLVSASPSSRIIGRRVFELHSGSPPSGACLIDRGRPRGRYVHPAARKAFVSSPRAFSMSCGLPVRSA